MWSPGALLFGHLTRNCRCSHCPGINSNYALYSDGFCASDPWPPHTFPPPSPLHSHTFPAFLCSPPTSATGELIWLLEQPGPIMNELTETFRQAKERTYQKGGCFFFLDWYLSSKDASLKTLDLFSWAKMLLAGCTFKVCRKVTFFVSFNCDAFSKIPILGNNLSKLTNPNPTHNLYI